MPEAKAASAQAAEARNSMRNIMFLAFKFGLVGLSSIGVYFILLYFLQPVIAQIWLLTAAAYVGSMVFNYMAQRAFTFRIRNAKDHSMLWRYFVLQGACLAFNSTAMYILVEVLMRDLWISQIGVTFVVAASSFILSKSWVFVRA